MEYNRLMRTKTKFVFNNPDPGTTRLKRVFAWIPKVIGGDKIWLEYFEELQGFIETKYTVIIDGEHKVVKVSNWVTLSKRVLN